MTCTKCELYKYAKINCMKTSGNLDSQILICGEAPGQQEDEDGIPFVGKSGQVLRDALKTAGIVDFAITNICRCRPPNNRTPTPEEIKICSLYTIDEINVGLPNLKLIVPVGNVALRAFTGKQGITRVSGEEWTWGDFKLMPLVHPRYVLENQLETDKFFNHVARINQILSGGLTSEEDFGEYHVIKTQKEWDELEDKLYHSKFFVYDLETTGLNPFFPDQFIRTINFSFSDREAYTLPLKQDWMEEEAVLTDLKFIFENRRIGKCNHNIKFDNLWMLSRLGIEVKGTVYDTMIAEYLLKGKGSLGLKELAWKFTRCGGYEKNLSDSPDKCDGEELWRYGAIDADITRRIMLLREPKLKSNENLYRAFKTLLVPISDVLMRMEYHGIKVDKEKIVEVNKNVEKHIDKVVSKIRKHPSIIAYEEVRDSDFNPNSHQQLREVLYKLEGLPVTKKTEKTKLPSTDQDVLEKFSKENKLCGYLLNYSMYNQMKKNFIKDLNTCTTPDGRIHTTLWLTESHSRTSSKNPNLQNLPKGENDILKIREIFITDEGYKLAEFDLSQHELRVLAEISGDENLKEALKGDVHTVTAHEIFGLSKDSNITSDQRREAKVVNFGIVYGLSDYGLAQQLDITQEKARAFMAKLFNKYDKIQVYWDWAKKFVRENGYLESLSGRRRYFPSWQELEDKYLKEAVNFPIQCSASDILLYGAIAVDKLLRGRKSFLTLEVHDSLLINLHKDEFGLIEEIKNAMTTYFLQYMDFSVPLKVDVSIGDNWGNLEKIK